ncbi:fibronectin type III domain-containing protein [Candidatus Riflebacteria bacterium]
MEKLFLTKRPSWLLPLGLLLFSLIIFIGCGSSVSETQLVDFERPNVPRNVTGIGRDRAILVNWDPNTEPDLVGYKVYRSLSGSGPFTELTTVPRTTSPNYWDTDFGNGLVNGSFYYYKISAFDTQGKESDMVNTNSVQVKAGTPAEELPPRVTDIKVKSDREKVFIAWKKVTGVNIKGYNIYRGLSVTAGGLRYLATVPALYPGYIDVSLNPASADQYTYVIRTVNLNNVESEASDAVSVTLRKGDDTVPLPPTNLSLTSDLDPVLTWTKPTRNEDGSPITGGQNATNDLESYLVFRANEQDRLFWLIGIVDDTGNSNPTQSFNITEGSSSDLYLVRALDRAGSISKPSSIVTRSANTNIPSTPQNLTAVSARSESAIQLRWDASLNASAYNIYFSLTADEAFTLYAANVPQGTLNSPYQLNAFPSNYEPDPRKSGQLLEFGIDYFFRVTALSSSGQESSTSNIASARPGALDVVILEGEDGGWGFVDRPPLALTHVFRTQSSSGFPFAKPFSGSGLVIVQPDTVSPTSGSADNYTYPDPNLAGTAGSFLKLRPNGVTTVLSYKVYAYHYPHNQGGVWGVFMQNDFGTAMISTTLNTYNSVGQGRLATFLGTVTLGTAENGVQVILWPTSFGAGGRTDLLLDGFVFVRTL